MEIIASSVGVENLKKAFLNNSVTRRASFSEGVSSSNKTKQQFASSSRSPREMGDETPRTFFRHQYGYVPTIDVPYVKIAESGIVEAVSKVDSI